MSKTIIVCGHGPGISDAVARKFGAEGFSVALVARRAEKLTAAVAALEAKGIKAAAFPTDLGDPNAVRAMVAKVRASLGPITVIHWNAYAGVGGDLTTAKVEEVRAPFDVAVTGLVVALQEALPDLKKEKNAAVLVTGGGFAFYDPKVDAMTVEWNAMGVAVSKAAQHKLVGLLGAKLGPLGIYVGEVVVLGMVKGTAFDSGHATLEASTIADKFWAIYGARAELTVSVTG
jgi:NADP-dependent 3-hydroxy acid dehydrogenase YdfG